MRPPLNNGQHTYVWEITLVCDHFLRVPVNVYNLYIRFLQSLKLPVVEHLLIVSKIIQNKQYAHNAANSKIVLREVGNDLVQEIFE